MKNATFPTRVSKAFFFLALYLLLTLQSTLQFYQPILSIFHGYNPLSALASLLINLMPVALILMLHLHAKQHPNAKKGMLLTLTVSAAALIAWGFLSALATVLNFGSGMELNAYTLICQTNLLHVLFRCYAAMCFLRAAKHIRRGTQTKPLGQFAILYVMIFFVGVQVIRATYSGVLLTDLGPILLILFANRLPRLMADAPGVMADPRQSMAFKTMVGWLIAAALALLLISRTVGTWVSPDIFSSGSFTSSGGPSGEPWKDLGVSKKEYMDIYNKFKYGN